MRTHPDAETCCASELGWLDVNYCASASIPNANGTGLYFAEGEFCVRGECKSRQLGRGPFFRWGRGKNRRAKYFRRSPPPRLGGIFCDLRGWEWGALAASFRRCLCPGASGGNWGTV